MLDRKYRRYPMTEELYFEAVNELLKTATPIGAYCLAFAEALRRNSGTMPPFETLEKFVACKSIAEGAREYENILECQRALRRMPGVSA